jgi:membrane protease YdiL (CAAX protease family)
LYLVALTAAEAITALVQPGVGMVMQSVLLVTLLLHGAIIWEHPVHRLFLSLTFVPLIRMLNLAVPLGTVPRLGWYLITGVPLALGGLVALRSLEISRKDAGLGWGRWPLVQIGVALSGLLIGYVEYQILRPAPLIDALTWDAVWFPALALLICTGFSEELIYRGIIQRAAVEVFGRLGVLYTAFLYAMLHMGFRSLENVLFVFLVGLWFGWVVHKTHNIWGVTFAHGLTNIVLFLVLPFVIGS